MAMQNVVATTLRMRNTAVRTARDLKHEVKDVGREAQRMGTKFGHAVKASRTSVAGLAGSFVSLRTIIAATFAYRAIQRFGKFLGSLLTLYQQQEDSTRMLAESLAGWNNYSKEMVSQLTKQAMAMQHVVNVDNEEIESMMALLASYGMTGDEIKRVIGLTIDFSKAKRIELKAAVDLVGKAFVGYTGTLSRYGIILDRNLSREEKYAATLEALNAFVGFSAGVTETYSGKVGVLGKAYDDMKKQMGAVIVKGIEQSGMLESLANGVEVVTDWLIKWEPLLANLVSGGLEDLRVKLTEITVTMQEGDLPRWLFTIGNAFQIVGKTISAVSGLIANGLTNIVIALKLSYKSKKLINMILLRDVKGFMKEAEALDQWVSERTDDIWNRRKKARLHDEAMWESIKKDLQDLKDIWSAPSGKDFLTRLGEKLEAARIKIIEERAAMERHNEELGKGIKNRGALNEKIAETIKLTENMARQYALASRVEQAQIKFLLEKAQELVPEDILNLSELEKKLITKQGVLKERFKDLMSVFTEQELKIELDDKTALDKIAAVRKAIYEKRAARVMELQDMGVEVEVKSEGVADTIKQLQKAREEAKKLEESKKVSAIDAARATREERAAELDAYEALHRKATLQERLAEMTSVPTGLNILSEADRIESHNQRMLELYRYQNQEKNKHNALIDTEIFKAQEANRIRKEGLDMEREKSTLFDEKPIKTGRSSTERRQQEDVGWMRETLRSMRGMGTYNIHIQMTPEARKFLEVREEHENKMKQRNFERAG